jgi:phosphoesterase RecJ-like protein
VDAGDLDRLGDLIPAEAWAAVPSIVIDHHESNPGFGDVNLVLPWMSSTAEIVLEVAQHMPVEVSSDVATALLTGLLADTMAFRTTNTSAGTLRRAATLVDLGAPQSVLIDRIFGSRPLASVRLLGRAIERLEVRGRLGVATLDGQELAAVQATHEAARGISSFLVSARELDAVALVRERDRQTCDVSMRSRIGTNLIPVAQRLGGGGHPQAAGATIPGPLAAAATAVWAALGAELGMSAALDTPATPVSR